jgi:hypothetical protein
MRPLPLPCASQRRDDAPLPPAVRRYQLRAPRAVVALRGLRAVTWSSAVAALFVGEASPEQILGELAQLLGDVRARWQGLTREQAIRKEEEAAMRKAGA